MANVPLRKIVTEVVEKSGQAFDDYCDRKLAEVEDDLYKGRIDVEKAMGEVERLLRDSKCYLESWHYSDIRKLINRHL